VFVWFASFGGVGLVCGGGVCLYPLLGMMKNIAEKRVMGVVKVQEVEARHKP
jgi:hypothetical protein